MNFEVDSIPIIFLSTDFTEMGSFTETEAQVVKEPLLGSPIVVGGVSFAVLCMGFIFGYILAKRKMKKEGQNY